MRSRTRLIPIMASVALSLLAVPAAHAQDASPAPTPSPFCVILSADEVSAALGVDVTVGESSDTDCSYQSDFTTGDYVVLDARAEDGTVAQLKEYFADYTDVTVGGRTAIQSPDASLLFIDVDSGVFTLQLVGAAAEGVDQAAAMASLAELALPRLAGVPLPSPEPEPSAFPMPSFVGDADLRALFPAQLGGEPLQVMTVTGTELGNVGDEDMLKELTDVLASAGKTIDDVSIGFGYSTAGTINALRVRGTDATTMVDVLGPVINNDLDDPQRTTVELGGKQVIKFTDGPVTDGAEARYLYPHDDVIWEVIAVEPALSEAFTALP